jgi:hypothetical protein
MNIKQILILLACVLIAIITKGQDSSNLTVGGYIDAYYSYDFNKPQNNERPYFVSMNKHDQFSVNLAYIDIKYNGANVRGKLTPGFGTYINSNYFAEPGTLKNIVEGYAGIKLSKKRNIWLDAGVFSTPFTTEGYLSKDQLVYTRSFAPEFVPYYLTGMKLSYPVNDKLNLYFYLVNGWQQIVDLNNSKSISTQVEYKPNKNWLFNWNTYVGNEKLPWSQRSNMLFFTDFFIIHTVDDVFTATANAYIGLMGNDTIFIPYNAWWQANIATKVQLNDKKSISWRLEHFNDPNNVMATPITQIKGFSSYSTTLCYNYKIYDNVLLRLEGRYFWSDQDVYMRNNIPVKTTNVLTTNLTIWF